MTLGATIGAEGADYFTFLTRQKSGCKLAIDVNPSKGLLGKGGEAAGSVQSKLDSYRISK